MYIYKVNNLYMTKLFTINEYKNIIRYYNYNMPSNINSIRKVANKLMVTKMCVSNYYFNNKLVSFLILIHKKKGISNNKKLKHNKTKKNCYTTVYNNTTRNLSPINHLCM